MKRIQFAFVLILLVACSHDNQKNEIKIGNLILKGDITNDSIFNGTISYYDSTGLLLSKRDFFNGIPNGKAINYYANGKIQDQADYFFGISNGYNIVNDSFGRIIYKRYSYYGRDVGPTISYHANGKVKDYIFSNFEGESIYYCSYDSLGKITGDNREYFQMNASYDIVNGQKKLNLFMYNLQPPKMSFNYKICIEDSNRNITETIKTIDSSQVFSESILPIQKNGFKYCIVLDMTDPISEKKHSFIREIISK